VQQQRDEITASSVANQSPVLVTADQKIGDALNPAGAMGSFPVDAPQLAV
jgi:hypothetical protein